MAGQVLVTETYLSDIGDSLRVMLESSDTYKPSEMAAAIKKIGAGSIQKASGTYALDTDNALTFLLGIDFVPDIFTCVLDETDITYDSTPTKGWILFRNPLFEKVGFAKSGNNLLNYDGTKYVNSISAAVAIRGVQGTNTMVLTGASVSGILETADGVAAVCGRTATAYPVIAGTYKWEAYKVYSEL